MRFGRSLDRSFGPTNLLRTEGTDALLAAAREAGVQRFVAQSFASYRYARVGGPVKTEDDPLDPDPPAMASQTNAAMRHLEEAVTSAGGIALRYGGFYGAANDGLVPSVRKRQFPVIGRAAASPPSSTSTTPRPRPCSRSAMTGRPVQHRRRRARPDVRVAARARGRAGAKPPRHVPMWLARLIAGKGMVMMAVGSRGASNAKAKQELGWKLRYPSWREGFAAAYAPDPDRGRRSWRPRSVAPAVSGPRSVAHARVSTARGRPLPGR